MEKTILFLHEKRNLHICGNCCCQLAVGGTYNKCPSCGVGFIGVVNLDKIFKSLI